MSRPIQFRAFNANDKVMIADLNSPRIHHGVLVHDSDDIIMQFTGLLDKNGVKIFEGDIIAHLSTRRAGYQKNGVTIYNKIVFGKSNTENSVLSDYIGFWAVSLSDVDIECGGSIEYMINSHGSIVVGNIYESPELLTNA